MHELADAARIFARMVADELRDELPARGETREQPDPDKTLTTAEAGAVVDRSPKTLRRWIAGGRLKATELHGRYRIRRADLDEAIRGKPTADLIQIGAIASRIVNGGKR